MFSTSYIMLALFVALVGTNPVFKAVGTSHYESSIDVTKAPFQARIKKTCGAAIISEYYLLTAAHCLYDKGNLYRKSEIGVGHELKSHLHWVEIEGYGIHELYNGYYLAYDIAYIKLMEPLQFNESVQPIPLSDVYPPLGSTAYITGWGEVDDRLWIDELQSMEMRVTDTYGMFLQGKSDRPGVKVGHGDSGGPVTWKGTLVGLVSWFKDYEEINGVTSIVYFRKWIREHTGV